MAQNCEREGRYSQFKVSAVTQSFIENSSLIKVFLRKFLRQTQDIEDVTQEAYLKAYVAEQEKSIDNPKSYLFTIAKNIAINELTKKAYQITDYIEECDVKETTKKTAPLEAEVEAQQALGIYCEAVAALPEACRRVFLLRKVHGLKQSEIAETLGVSLRNVEMHLQKGTLRCREFIREHQGSDVLANQKSKGQFELKEEAL